MTLCLYLALLIIGVHIIHNLRSKGDLDYQFFCGVQIKTCERYR